MCALEGSDVGKERDFVEVRFRPGNPASLHSSVDEDDDDGHYFRKA